MSKLVASELKRVNVVGTSGSGKSTFGRKLAEILGVGFIEMDALFWGPNWQQPSDEVFFSRLTDEISEEGWVLDGNYTRTIPVKWSKTQMVVWLDYSFSRTLFRAIRRAVSRCISQQELWPGTGNRESVRSLFSRKSIVLWTIQTHGSNRRKYESLMADTQHSHIEFVRLRTPKEAEEFLQGLIDSG